MKNFVLYVVLLIVCFSCSTPVPQEKPLTEEEKRELAIKDSIENIHKYIDSLKQYADTNNMCTDIVIDVDFSIHPGKNRFFIYNCKIYEVVFKGLCAHGSPDWWLGDTTIKSITTAQFSNRPGSNLSSIGHYKVARMAGYSPKVGDNFVVYGLDKTNSNAQRRYIKIHGWPAIPDEECYPEYIMCSEGCFMLSVGGINEVIEIIESQKKNVFLYAHR